MRVFLQRFFFLQESKARRRQLWFISLFVLLGLSWPSPDQAWILPTRPTVLLPYLWTFISLHRGIPVHCVMPETWLYCTVYMAHTFYFSFSPHPQKKKNFLKAKNPGGINLLPFRAEGFFSFAAFFLHELFMIFWRALTDHVNNVFNRRTH